MSKAECHFLPAGHKSCASRIIMRSLRWRAPDISPPSLAECELSVHFLTQSHTLTILWEAQLETGRMTLKCQEECIQP